MTTTAPAASARQQLLAAAVSLFAEHGPDAVPLRQVAAHCGCTHALVARHFGSRLGLEHAVVAEVARSVNRTMATALASPGTAGGGTGAGTGTGTGTGGSTADPFGRILDDAAHDPTMRRLVVRCGLGELDVAPLLGPDNPAQQLMSWIEAQRPVATPQVAQRTRVGTYAALSVVLGWLTFEGFISPAAGLGPIAPHQRRQAMAEAASMLARVALDNQPSLRSVPAAPCAPAKGATATAQASHPMPAQPMMPMPAPSGPVRGRHHTRQALIDAAVQLFSTRSPGAITTRELAVRAGVNQGLIYRHFGSKAALVRAALDAGVANLLPASMDAAGFDLEATISLVRHRSPAAAIIARTLVDGIDMTTVRPTFPVIGRLVQAYPDCPSGAGPGNLTDPRLAVAATAALVTGSAIWDRPLRIATGIDPAVNLDQPIATLARLLLDAPSPSVPVVRGRH